MELSSMAAAIREYELRAAKRSVTEALMFARAQKWERAYRNARIEVAEQNNDKDT